MTVGQVVVPQLTEWPFRLTGLTIVPARRRKLCRLRYQHDVVLGTTAVVGLTITPVEVAGREDAAAVGADKLTLGHDVGDAEPDLGPASGVNGALVLLF